MECSSAGCSKGIDGNVVAKLVLKESAMVDDNGQNEILNSESNVLKELEDLLADFDPIIEEDFATVGDATRITLSKCPACTRCKVIPEPGEVIEGATKNLSSVTPRV